MDPFTLAILGGGMGLSMGMDVASGLISQEGARDAQAGQLGQLDLARADNFMTTQQMQQLFAPYQAYGSSALGFLQDRILTSTERKMASIKQRTSLAAEVDRLSQVIDWTTVPLLTGDKASERRQSMWMEMEFQRKEQLKAAQAKLNAFDREQKALAPLQTQQEAFLKNRQNRVDAALNKLTALSNQDWSIPQSLSQLRSELTNDPVFQFRQAEGQRAINRAQAARGNFLSGAALEEISDFNQQLTADETDRYFNRLLQAKTTEFGLESQAAVTALNAELGVNQQDISNMMGLAQLGLNAAQGQAQVGMQGNQVNAGLRSEAGQAIANTEMAKANAEAGIYKGIGNTIGQATGLMSMMSMFNPGGMQTKQQMSNSALNQLTYGSR
jgi:hypothetical protein